MEHRFQIRLCTENIEWAKNENRTFLRQALEVCWTNINNFNFEII